MPLRRPLRFQSEWFDNIDMARPGGSRPNEIPNFVHPNVLVS